MNKALQTLLIAFGLSAFGLATLFFTGYRFDLTVFTQLVRLQPLYLLLLLPALFGWWAMMGWRMQLLADSPQITLSRGIKAHLLCLFGAAVTPSGAAANALLAWYLSRFINIKLATAVAVYNLTLDLTYYAWSLPLCFMILHFKGINLGVPIIGDVIGAVAFIGSIVSATLVYALTYQLDRLRGLIFWIFSLEFLRKKRRTALRFVIETGFTIKKIRQMPLQTQALMHISTTLGFALHFALANIIVAGLGLPVDHLALLTMQSLLVAIGFIVPTPGGAGYFEVVLGSSSRAVGIPDSAVVPFIVIWRFLSYYLYVAIGPFIGAPALLLGSQNTLRK